MTRAVLEGVAFGLRDSAEAMKDAGASFNSLMAIGGGAASTYWLRLIATTLNTPLSLPTEGAFGAALGAARLAIGAVTQEKPENIMQMPDLQETIDPEPGLMPAFDEAYHKFRATYPALKTIP